MLPKKGLDAVKVVREEERRVEEEGVRASSSSRKGMGCSNF